MTYDCRRGIPTQYCVHFMSREPTMDEGVLQELVQLANNMGLNPRNLTLEYISHEGCW